MASKKWDDILSNDNEFTGTKDVFNTAMFDRSLGCDLHAGSVDYNPGVVNQCDTLCFDCIIYAGVCDRESIAMTKRRWQVMK